MTSTITTTMPLGTYGATMSTTTIAPNYGNVTIASSTGQYMYSNGTNATWSSPNTITTGAYPSNSLQVKGDAEFEGDVKIKGKSIIELFDNIEKRLAILHPNIKLEEKWEKLKELGEQYRALEKEIIEKEKIWAILKD